jgi:Lrp/AsnC family leucine-responsive transcriptional regulator
MIDPLDAIDRRILGVLQKDSRVTNAELSERVNLSPSACHRRVQRLEQDGFIAAYVALLDARKMGKPTIVFVEITLQSQAEDLLDAFEREVAKVPDILECHLMAGTADYLLKVVAQIHSSFALRTVVKRTDTQIKGFIVLPKRWVVERTLGWINRARRLSKDFEATIESALAWLQLALAFLLMRRLARLKTAAV